MGAWKGGGGGVLNKSITTVLFGGYCKGQEKDTRKLKRVMQGQVVTLCNAVTQ